MLPYLGSGRRDYRRSPVQPHARGVWEFQTFLRGRAILLLPGRRVEGPSTGSVLVISGPECVHGWTGDGALAEVAVFHFREVPPEVRAIVAVDGWRMLALDGPAEAAFRRLVGDVERERASVRPWSRLRYERVLIEASLEAVRLVSADTPQGRSSEPVERCMRWYLAHLADDPPLSAVARANGLSVSHARRLFHAALGRGPHAVMDELRFRRALELIEFSDLPLSAVATEIGYSEPAAFSRAFKRRHGATPSDWRRGAAGTGDGTKTMRGNEPRRA